MPTDKEKKLSLGYWTPGTQSLHDAAIEKYFMGFPYQTPSVYEDGETLGVEDITDWVENGAVGLYDSANATSGYSYYKSPDGRIIRVNDYENINRDGLIPMEYSELRKMLPKREYIGGDNYRFRTMQRIPGFIDYISERAKAYGVDPNLVLHRIGKEGWIDQIVQRYNGLDASQQNDSFWSGLWNLPVGGFGSFGLDDAGSNLMSGKYELLDQSARWEEWDATNEKGRQVKSIRTEDLKSAIEIKAAEMAYRQKEVEKRYGKKGKDLNTWTNAAFNMGLNHDKLSDEGYVRRNYTYPDYIGEIQTQKKLGGIIERIGRDRLKTALQKRFDEGGNKDEEKFAVRDNTKVSYMPQSIGFLPALNKPIPSRDDVRLDDGPMGFIPVVGDILQGGQAVRDFFNGDYGKAAIGTGLLVLPNAVEKPLKSLGTAAKKFLRNADIRSVDDLYDAAKNVVDAAKRRNRYIGTEFEKYPEFAQFLKETKMEPSQVAVDLFARRQGTSARGVNVPTEFRRIKFFGDDDIRGMEQYGIIKDGWEDNDSWVFNTMAGQELNENEKRVLEDYMLTHSPFDDDALVLRNRLFDMYSGADQLGSSGVYSSNSYNVAANNAHGYGHRSSWHTGDGSYGKIGVIEMPISHDKSLPLEKQLDQIAAPIFNYDDIIHGQKLGLGAEDDISRAADDAGFSLGDHKYSQFSDSGDIYERTSLNPYDSFSIRTKISEPKNFISTDRYGLHQQERFPIVDNKLFIPKITTERDIERVADLLSWMPTSFGDPVFKNGGKIHIKPSHRGRLTKLKERTGKTEAELYNDGNPAHKKMVVFARNSRKWHGDGGLLRRFDEGGDKNKPQSPQEYIVQPGDTLTGISKRLTGNMMNYLSIAGANGVENPDLIRVGQKLLIPEKFDAPMKKADIPTSNKTIVIDNYSPRWNYIVEGDKVYYAPKGRDHWVDISDNGKARQNLLNFLGDKYDFRGYEDDERKIRDRVNAGNFDYKQYRDSLNRVALGIPEPARQGPKEVLPAIDINDESNPYQLPYQYQPRQKSSGWSVIMPEGIEYPDVSFVMPSAAIEPMVVPEPEKYVAPYNPDPITSYALGLVKKAKDTINGNDDLRGIVDTYKEEGAGAAGKMIWNGLMRQVEKRLGNNEQDAVMPPPDFGMENSEYDLIPSSFTGDTLRYRKGVLPREYFIPESIDVTKHRFGARNRGDYTELNTEGGIVTTFHGFNDYDKDAVKDNATYIGIDSEGNLKAGTGVEFGPGDKLTRSYANEVYSFARDDNGNYKFKSDAKHGNAKQNVALVNVKDEKTGQMRESAALNVLVRADDKEGKTYGSITGGRVLVKVGNEMRLLSGSLSQIESEFEAMKERQGTDHGTFYTLDNGSFNKALRTYDKKLTSADLSNYDKKNSGGGNFLYLLEGEKPMQFPQDTVLTPNIRTEQSESYKKGHPLQNANTGVLLHYTAFSDGNDMSGVTRHFMNPKSDASAHVLITPNGARRVFADENAVTFHAGESTFNGVDNVNDFMHGIEFQAPGPNTPLTKEQVDSAVEYLERYIRKYNIPIESITTHETVRKNFLEKYAGKKEARGVLPKQDLSPAQFKQVIDALKQRVYYKKNRKDSGGLIERYGREAVLAALKKRSK